MIAGDGTGQAENVDPGTEVSLTAGDAIILHNEDGDVWTTGDAPVEVLTGAVFAGYSPGPINPTDWEFGPSSLADNTLQLPEGPYLRPDARRARPEWRGFLCRRTV